MHVSETGFCYVSRRLRSVVQYRLCAVTFFFILYIFSVLSVLQAFLLGIVYLIFALWRLMDILQSDLGGNTMAAEFMLFIKTRSVRNRVIDRQRVLICYVCRSVTATVCAATTYPCVTTRYLCLSAERTADSSSEGERGKMMRACVFRQSIQ